MDLDYSPEDLVFREEARTWLEENKPREERPEDGPAMREFDTAWQRAQYEGGWAGISWPKQWGGRDLSLLQQLLWYEQYAEAGAPWIGCSFVGLSHAGPTLIARGSDEQRGRHLPAILRGEEIWCQGFSEPGSGSDLAGLKTKAVIDGDELVVTGQKIWTSFADQADVQELLVRTDPSGSKHHGITWVICDMKTPGLEVRPIRNISRNREFCEVFYDEVRIPLSNVVGEINDGWSVAMSTLSFERGTAFMANIIELSATLERLIVQARDTPGTRGRASLYDDDRVRYELARLRAEIASLRSLNYATVSRIRKVGKPGPEGSIVRLYYALLTQRTLRLATEIFGSDAGVHWPLGYLDSFRAPIAAGTKDIQHNIIGERLLGLPKDR